MMFYFVVGVLTGIVVCSFIVFFFGKSGRAELEHEIMMLREELQWLCWKDKK